MDTYVYPCGILVYACTCVHVYKCFAGMYIHSHGSFGNGCRVENSGLETQQNPPAVTQKASNHSCNRDPSTSQMAWAVTASCLRNLLVTHCVI